MLLVLYNRRVAFISLLSCIMLSYQFSFEPVFLDHVGRFFADHESHRIGMPGRYDGHDGSVDHPEAFNATHSELRVHNGVRVRFRPHLTGAWLVVQVGGNQPGGAHPIRIRHERLVFAAGERNRQQPWTVFLKRRSLAHCNSLWKELAIKSLLLPIVIVGT